MCHRLALIFTLLIPGTVFCNAFADETPVPVKKLPFTISKETTWLTEPLNPDGTVNYVKAINDKYSKGVTQENNAAVLLVQAFGPSYMADSIRDRTLKMLGIDKLPEKGDYFITYDEYCEKHAKELSEEDCEKQLDRAKRAPWDDKDCPLVAGWIKANEKPMKLIIQATKRPRYWMPMLSPDDPPVLYHSSLPALGRYRQSAICLAAHAMLKLKSGQMSIAFEYLESMYRLASYQSEGPVFVHYLIGLAAQREGDLLAKQMAFCGHLNRSQLVKLLQICQSVKPFNQPVKPFHNERYILIDSCMAFLRQPSASFSFSTKLLKPYYLYVDWDEIFKVNNRFFDELVEASQITNYKQRIKALDEWDQKILVFRKTGKTEYYVKAFEKIRGAKVNDPSARKIATDAINRYLYILFSPVIAKASEIRDHGVTQSQINRIAIALTIYKLDHGQFPKQLDALSPKYLKVIPNDMFSGKPFIYRLTEKGFILYSVMTNGKDDGGISDDETDKDDFLIAEYPAKSK